MRRVAVLGVVAIGALAAPLLASSSGPPVSLHLAAEPAGPVLGFVHSENGFTSPGDSILTRLDPRTLEPTGGTRIRFSPAAGGAAYSPDRSRLAIVDGAGRLFVVDTRRLRILMSVRRPVFGQLLAPLAWIAGRVVLVPARSAGPFAVDPSSGRIQQLPALKGAVVATGETRADLVVLLAPQKGQTGDCELARTPPEGRIESVAIPETRCSSPGLAVDPGGDRAFVAAGDSSVVEVDLRTMAVSRHHLARPTGVIPSLLGWLAPAAEAKSVPEGQLRTALWLGGDRLVVWGADFTNSSGIARPVGASLVDTSSWATRMLDPGAQWVQRSSETLVTSGADGMTVYGADGKVRLRLFKGRDVFAEVGFGHAVVSATLHPARYWVVDLGTGKIVRSGPIASMPSLLDANTAP